MSESFVSIVILVALAGGLLFLVQAVVSMRGMVVVSMADKRLIMAPSLRSSTPSSAAVPRPECLRLAPEYHCAPLWDDTLGHMIDPASLGLSPDLLHRITSWDNVFQATFREDDPFASGFDDLAAEHAWVKEGNAIAQDLEQEWPGRLRNQISVLTDLVRDARSDLGPWDKLPDDRLAAIGKKCTVAEIEAAIVRIDALSQEGDALPDWDGDSQDDIARAREMLQGILARVPERYIDIVASGLGSPQWRTRVHSAMALAGHNRAYVLPILRRALAREEDETARQLIALALAQVESAGQ